MKPYYETEFGTLFCGDNMEILPSLKDVDLCLTDPPYGIGELRYDSVHNKTKAKKSGDYGSYNWNSKIPSRAIFDMIFAKSKNQIFFGGNYFVEYLKNSRCWIVWDKCNESSTFADCELAWTSFTKKSVKKYTYLWNGMLQGLVVGGRARQGNKKENEKRYHPTQKPVKLFEAILSDYSKMKGTVLDPFAGSGTTALACINLRRNFILIEKEEAYCEIIAKRIEQQLRQTTLLDLIN